MKTIDHENLFKRYQSGEATLEEQAIVEDYILNNEFTPLYLTEDELEGVKAKLGKRISEIPFAGISETASKGSTAEDEVVANEERMVGSRSRFPLWMASAAAVAAIVFGVWFFNSERGVLKQVQDDVAYKNDIKPGKNTATLTLANGKTIALSDAKTGVVIDASRITYSDNTVISTEHSDERSLNNTNGKDPSVVGMTGKVQMTGKMQMTGKVQMTSVSTPRGGTYQVILPDGTKVWLNAASSIKFPSSFAGLKQRKVVLTGEAYFEVSKNKIQPFVVSSKNQDVTVLGTHFNINSYEDEGSVKTTLLEGSVSVSSSRQSVATRDLSSGGKDLSVLRDDGEERTGGTVLLKPNQQSTLTQQGGIKVADVDPSDAVSWKNGEFVFSSEDIPTIMRKIARWYDVAVEYKGDVSKKRFTGTVSRYANVSEVLQTLELTKGISFKIDGRKIIVSN